MKKILLSIALATVSTFAFAQRPTDGENPFSLEVQLNLDGTTIQAPTIRFRYFATDNIAARVGFGIDNSSLTQYAYGDLDGGTDSTGTYKTNDNQWLATIGATYHFGQLEKLSPYAGIDIGFGGGKTTVDAEQTNNGSTWIDNYNEKSKNSYGLFAFNLVAGVDWYISKNLYLGAEFGLGLTSTSDKGGESTINNSGVETTVDFRPQTDNSSFANNAVGGLRFGWRF